MSSSSLQEIYTSECERENYIPNKQFVSYLSSVIFSNIEELPIEFIGNQTKNFNSRLKDKDLELLLSGLYSHYQKSFTISSDSLGEIFQVNNLEDKIEKYKENLKEYQIGAHWIYTNMFHINLRYNHLTSTSMHHLGFSLLHCSNLQVLDLSHNDLGPRGGQILFTYLNQLNKTEQ